MILRSGTTWSARRRSGSYLTGDIQSIAVRADGWSADVLLTALSVGGTYDLGLGANNDPDTGTPKLVFTVTSPGYDDTATLITRQRTIYGQCAIKKPYPNQAQNDETVVGTNVSVRIVLSERIYAGDIVTAVVESAVYTQGSVPSNPHTVMSVTNNSPVTWDKAKVIGRWASLPHRRLTSTVDVEFVAFQTYAEQGRPVRCVKFIVSDGTTTAEQIVTDLTLATVPVGMPAIPVYACTMSTAAFVQGSDLTVQAVAYPWVGDATAIRDTGTSVAADGTTLHAQLHLCDKDSTYIQPYAYVDASSDLAISGSITGSLTDREVITQTTSGATAVVVGATSGTGPLKICGITGTPNGSDTWTGGTSAATFTPASTPVARGITAGVPSATAATAKATPYNTLWNAVKGVRDFINTNAGRANNVNGGVVRLMEGDVRWGRDGTASTMSATSAALIVEGDPDIDRSAVRLRGDGTSAQNLLIRNIFIRHLTIQPSAADQSNFMSGSATAGVDVLTFEDIIRKQDTDASKRAGSKIVYLPSMA
jgi:hypothetical protein